MTRDKMYAKVQLTDAQFDGLDTDTKRSLIQQIMLIRTPKYEYAWGCQGQWWTIVRYEIVDAGTIDKDTAEIVDKWL